MEFFFSLNESEVRQRCFIIIFALLSVLLLFKDVWKLADIREWLHFARLKAYVVLETQLIPIRPETILQRMPIWAHIFEWTIRCTFRNFSMWNFFFLLLLFTLPSSVIYRSEINSDSLMIDFRLTFVYFTGKVELLKKRGGGADNFHFFPYLICEDIW